MSDTTLADIIKSSTAVYYPSAGGDLRDLMVMSGICPGSEPYHIRGRMLSCMAGHFIRRPYGHSSLPLPDLFIHSDVESWEKDLRFRAGEVFFQDPHTSILVKDLRELPRIRLSRDVDRFADFAHYKEDIGRCALMTIQITSDVLGTFERRLAYVCSANEVFAAEYLLAKKLPIAGLVHVRYGIGFGGARGSGSWLKAIMPKLNAKFLFSDYEIDYKDYAKSSSVYPELAGLHDVPLRCVDYVPGRFWSNISDVDLLVPDEDGHDDRRSRPLCQFL